MAVLREEIKIPSTRFSEHKKSSKLLFYEPATVQLSSKCDTLKATYSVRRTTILVQII
jgi:hypothetical protein